MLGVNAIKEMLYDALDNEIFHASGRECIVTISRNQVFVVQLRLPRKSPAVSAVGGGG